jgi:hypothetical protein
VEKERQKGTSHFFFKTPNGTKEKDTLKGTTGMDRLLGSSPSK